MNSFVLGCSVAVAWLLEDERIPEADELLDRLDDGGEAVVPGLWRLELGNVLAGAERRNRISGPGVARCLGILARLPIVTDPHTDERALRETLELARREYLTTYDAAYLELAMRRGLPLATLDRPLARAARRAGVDVLPG
ncbi:MAG: type II toxin-antitoxin system VapC family toxin [Gemmatimonadetes bacterium]|nr:type II toxin-antitoxin system VapC family toxin [Gemmatimonadota bacterium]MYD12403.1 type II toxin-antitoxin system VapC family toxin [Gemmatimonadota bacterium]MYI65183.1 type II toxin-antitoxin system VapC family toxin [Gemmatimonadota bacterium]